MLLAVIGMTCGVPCVSGQGHGSVGVDYFLLCDPSGLTNKEYSVRLQMHGQETKVST